MSRVHVGPAGPAECPGPWVITGTLAPARRAVSAHRPLEGSATTLHRPCSAAGGRSLGGLPGGGRGGFRQETRSRDRGPGCGLGSTGPPDASEAEGAGWSAPPAPVSPGWHRWGSVPRLLQGQACCLEGWEFGSLRAWKVQRPRECGTQGAKAPSGTKGQSARPGRAAGP